MRSSISRICWNTQCPVASSFQPTVNCTDWESKFRQTETTISASASGALCRRVVLRPLPEDSG